MGCGSSKQAAVVRQDESVHGYQHRDVVYVRPAHEHKNTSTDTNLVPRQDKQTGTVTQEDKHTTTVAQENKQTATVKPTKHVSETKKIEEERERKELIAATEGEDIDRLETAIGNFQQRGLEDKGDLTKARNRLIQLHLENLRRATRDRKLENLDDAIDSAHSSYVSDDLMDSEELADAEKTRRQLRRLKRYLHKVLQLNKATIAEMHSYQRPRPLVRQVMKATFRILGESNSRVQDWSYLQASMRQLGPNSMLTRMRNCDVVDLSKRQVTDAEGYLGETRKYLVRNCSAGAGTFYVWSSNMIKEYHGKSDDAQATYRSNSNNNMNYNNNVNNRRRRADKRNMKENLNNSFTSSKLETSRYGAKSRN